MNFISAFRSIGAMAPMHSGNRFFAKVLCHGLFWTFLGYPCAAISATGLQSPVPIAPYLNGIFPETAPTANIDTANETVWVSRDYFPGITFVEPLRIIEHPTQNKLLVVGKDGKGHLITNEENSTDKTEFLNIQPIMHGNPSVGEGGISDVVFHPDFGDTQSNSGNYVYISYWWSPVNVGTFSNDNGLDGYNRLSRFEVVGGSVSLATELVLINQYDKEFWHIGMDLEFGPDGFLYISVGDESPTDCCDKRDTTQRLDGGLWSGVLRIDVDNDPLRSHAIRRQPRHPGFDPTTRGSVWPASYTQGYSIPNDNPFLAADGSQLEEFYSIGFRHPWTMKFDQQTGDLWVADVGHYHREEINLVEKGGNYQWPYKEGTRVGPVSKPSQVFGFEKGPTWEYAHEIGKAVIGAGVYRGVRFPELFGKFVFSDFTSGVLWAAEPDGDRYSANQIGSVSSGWGNGVQGYLLDSKGQILMVKTQGGLKESTVQTLVRKSDSAFDETAPAFLSATGAFTDLTNLTPSAGCIPYTPVVPFWSDGATKYRWICLPNDGAHDTPAEHIQFSAEDVWKFPVGTVFIKHFDMEANEGDPDSLFRIETRFLVHGVEGYYGLSYRWNDQGTDAILVGGDGDTRLFQQTNSGIVDRTWEFPSRNQCLECHLGVAGSVLGVNTRQLNRLQVFPSSGISANQIKTFNHLGMFSSDVPDSMIESAVKAISLSDTTASLEMRARSYLDSNCAYCHRPGGVRANFDARLTTPLSQQNLLNGALLESYGIADDEVVIAPGSAVSSIALYRASQVSGNLVMPPLGKNIVDKQGVGILQSWIVSMGAANDSDIDGDGVADNLDAFPNDPLETSDMDRDGIGDNADGFPDDPDNDLDSDGISGIIDNCPTVSNAGQEDADNNGVGDACVGLESNIEPQAPDDQASLAGSSSSGGAAWWFVLILAGANLCRRARE